MYVPPPLTISNNAFCNCGFLHVSHCKQTLPTQMLNLVFAMVKRSVLFKVRTKYLNIS
jgi:hypothetical protein